MRVHQALRFTLISVGILLGWATNAWAQLNSNQATVSLTATLSESLTLLVSPGSVDFTLLPSGVSNGNSTVSITTTWVLEETRTAVNVYAYFSSTTALTSGSNTIATSRVLGSVNSGSYSAFTGGSGPFGNESISVAAQTINSGNPNSSRNDTLDLRIDTTSLGIPAGTYTGVLNIRAQAL